MLATATLLLILAMTPLTVSGQATITPNYKDADIQQIIEAVGAVTGKNFIIDPRVPFSITAICLLIIPSNIIVTYFGFPAFQYFVRLQDNRLRFNRF